MTAPRPITPWELRRAAPAPATPLTGDHIGSDAFDTVIIGAGLAGLSVAWRLAEATSGARRIAVLEAYTPGFGASGRNAGMVLDYPLITSWLAPTALPGSERREAQLALRRLHQSTMREVEHLAPTTRTRFVLSSRVPMAGPAMRWLANEAASCGVIATPLGAGETQAELGWRAAGGCSLPATALDPLAVVDGLVEHVQSLGVSVFSGAAVASVVTTGSRLRCEVEGRAVEASTVVMAGNAYAPDGLVPTAQGHRPPRIRTHALLTEPLEGSVIDDLGGPELLVGEVGGGFAFRRMVDGRLLYGAFDVPDATLATDGRNEDRTNARLRRHMEHRLPALKGVGVDAQWHGHFIRTRSECPIIKRSSLEPRVVLATGFAGSGVGLSLTSGLLVRGLLEPELDTADAARVRRALEATRLGAVAVAMTAVRVARSVRSTPRPPT